jgi:hypothetical protein
MLISTNWIDLRRVTNMGPYFCALKVWFDPDRGTARLNLLSPVGAWAYGNPINASIGAGNLLSKIVPIMIPWEIFTRGELEKVYHFGRRKLVNSWIHEDQQIAKPMKGNAPRKRICIIDGIVFRKSPVNRSFYIKLKAKANLLLLLCILHLIFVVEICSHFWLLIAPPKFSLHKASRHGERVQGNFCPTPV